MTISPQTPYLTFVNKMTTGAPDSEYKLTPNDVPASNGTHTVTLTGSVPAGKSIVDDFPVPDPKAFAQAAFTEALTDAGVAIAPPPPANLPHVPDTTKYTDANRLAQHVSPPLSEDVYVTLKVSHNTHAGLMPLMWAVYLAHAKVDYLKAGFAKEHELLTNAGLDTSNADQQDGLGGFAFFTPQFMVSYLAWVYKQPWYASFHRALPILGVDGTLFNIQNGSPADGKVFAKTGTWGTNDLLNDRGLVTKGLAGFTTTRTGHHIAFAFWINRMPGKQSLDLSKDGAHHAGELLGAMAAAAYLNY
jgi:D-alanyl-D-alanine carboxypeptidase/D-alanyl-D-alanine-endopeptidase (penicillin-binding protein 4)